MPSPETPDRLTITDLQNNDSIEAMFNPNALTRRIAVNYAKKAVLGNSHQEHEYLQTDNMQIMFDLFFNVETPADLAKATASINFLESLCYGPADPESIAQAAPPRCLLVWPRTMSLVARLVSVEVRHQRWNRFGNTTQATVSTTWQEDRLSRLFKGDVRLLGAFRPSENPESD